MTGKESSQKEARGGRGGQNKQSTEIKPAHTWAISTSSGEMRDGVQVPRKQPGWCAGAAWRTSTSMGYTEKHDLYLTTTQLQVTRHLSVLDVA